MNKREKKITLSKVFDGNLKRGDFVEFIHGKILYQVTYVYDDRYNLRSVKSHRYITLWEKDWGRIFKIGKKEAMRKVCLLHPDNLRLYFKANEWREFFLENLKEEEE